ncbi:MAG: pyruvate kinase [Bacteroidetes bacterium]|nr:pyruvate kinase [Bacteroidota bacterium]
MKSNNRTKIIATIGPASSSRKAIFNLIKAGVDVCRINFSHGKHEDHLKVIQNVKSVNKELHVHTALLGDLQGPKLRIGNVENNGVRLDKGKTLIFTTKKCIGTPEKVFISYQQFPKDVKAKQKVLIDDGKIMLEVISTNRKSEVRTRVISGGILSSRKGVNLPDTNISLPCLTGKDLKDLNFALKNNVEWIGLSFVRKASDIKKLLGIIRKKGSQVKVVAKMEKPEAIANMNEIIDASDAVMVARGDLGVEIPMQDVPLVQKQLISECLKASKPIIVATQMMESMIENISPTRAEVNDVANSVMDGADALMLSGETSVGNHPTAVIKAMHKIIANVEAYENIYNKVYTFSKNKERMVSDNICYNACTLSDRIKATGIVTMTMSGYTAFKISGFRPKARIYVFTSNHSILNTLNLIWGVTGFYYDKLVSTDDTIEDIINILKKDKRIKKDDMLINIASMPIKEKGQSNMIKLSKVK